MHIILFLRSVHYNHNNKELLNQVERMAGKVLTLRSTSVSPLLYYQIGGDIITSIHVQ